MYEEFDHSGLALVRAIDLDLPAKEQIIALDRLIFGESGLTLWLLSPLLHYGLVLCLYHRHELIGVAEFIRSWAEETIYVYGFGVHPAYRGKGCGKWFFRKCMEFLRREGIKTIELTVSPDNIRAVGLYKSFGFYKVKDLPAEYGEKEFRWLMRVHLTDEGK